MKSSYSKAPKRALVVGGGFGGLAVVEGMARALGGSREAGVALLFDWTVDLFARPDTSKVFED